MKSKFGFIPIVLPVLVMVLIIGLINLGGPQGVLADDGTASNTSTVDIAFTALDGDGVPITSAAGGIQMNSESPQVGTSTDRDHDDDDDALESTDTYIARHFPNAREADSTRDTVYVGLQTESIAIGVETLPAGYVVTVNGLTLPEDADFANNNTDTDGTATIGLRRSLKEGNNFLTIVIRGDGASSRHSINVRRAPSTAPTFAGNDIDDLQDTYRYQHNVLITETAYPGQVIELPSVVPNSGNAPFTYSVQEVEAGTDSANLPEGMWLVNDMDASAYADIDLTGSPDQDPPTAVPNHLDITDPDPTSPAITGAVPIFLAGFPRIRGDSGYARHEMVYRVEDHDGDKAEIRFTIIITRDKPAAPTGDEDDAARSAAYPSGIRVNHGTITCGTPPVTVIDPGDATTFVTPSLSPAFGKSTNDTYTVTVPTDIQLVNIEVDIATTTTSTMTINNLGTTPGDIDRTTVSGQVTYKWTGQRIVRKERGTSAQVRNEYVIRSTVGTGDNKVEKTITLYVIRDEDKQPEFPMNGLVRHHFFEGMLLNTSSDDLPWVELPVVAKGDMGNATSSYSFMEKTGDTTDTADDRYLGLEFDSTTDPMQPVLKGTTRLDSEPQKAQESHVVGTYRVVDSDCNVDTTTARRMKDSDELDVEIRVYRDTTLHDYSADDTPNDPDTGGEMKGDLGISSKQVRLVNGVPSLTYRYDDDLNGDGLSDLPAYTYALPSDPATTTLQLRVNVESTVEVSVNGAAVKATRGAPLSAPMDDEVDYMVENVMLNEGDNEVSVKVTNGTPPTASNLPNTAVATHVLNISRPGLAAANIIVKEHEDSRNPDRFSAEVVKMTPKFNPAVRSYTLDVETYITAVEITVAQSMAQEDRGIKVSVQGFDIEGDEEAKVVDLELGLNVITVSVTNDVGARQKKTDYTLNITRLMDTQPTFGTSTVADMRYNPGDEVDLKLPTATMGNGMLTYGLVDDDDLPLGLDFDAGTATRTPSISGTPRLETGFSSDYYITYRVMDEDDSGCPGDCDTRNFVITVTKGELDPDPAPGTPTQYPEGEGPHTLHEIVVDYVRDGTSFKILAEELSPPFNPANGGPYTATIPHDYTEVTVTANPSHDSAKITINQVRINAGQKIVLRGNANIVVTSPDGSRSMEYTLVIEPTTDADPAVPDIENQVLPANRGIDPWQLPEATGGNPPLTYSLTNSSNALPPGLFFDAETRTLTGTPRLAADAVRTVYQMTYKVTDQDGDMATDMFNLTICDSTSPRSGNCEATTPTTPDPDPTPTMTETLTEWRGSDSTTVTLTWTPDMMNGTAAAYQYVFSVAKVAGDPVSGTAGLELGTFKYEPTITGGDTYMVELTGLMADRDYVYGVIALFGSPGNWTWGMWEIINYTP